MKRTIKALALALALVMLMATGMTAMATGTGVTITIKNAEKDVTYTLYKLFDATVATNGGVTYTLMSGKTNLGTNGDTWFELFDGNRVQAKSSLNADAMNSTAFKTWAESYGVQAGEKKADGTPTAFTNLTPGYYYLKTDRQGTTSKPALIVVDTAIGNVEIQDKNEGSGWIGPGKVIIAPNGDKKVLTSVVMDQPINFAIEVDAVRYAGSEVIYAYVITDDFDEDMTYTSGVTVKYAGTPIPANDYTVYYYTTTTPASGTDNRTPIATTEPWKTARSFKVVIPWTKNQGFDPNADGFEFLYSAVTGVIQVSYTGKLDSAKVAPKLANNPDYLKDKSADGFQNKARFAPQHAKPGDNPPPPPVVVPPTGELPEKNTINYTAELIVTKVDGNGKALTGAGFTLTSTDAKGVSVVVKAKFTQDNANGTYWKLKDGSYTTTNPNTPNIDQTAYESLENKYVKSFETTVNGDPAANMNVTGTVDGEGKLIFTGLGAGNYKLTESTVPSGFNKADDISFTLTFNETDKKFVSSNNKVPVEANGVQLKVTVENKQGTELPATGGVGTTVFYVAGSVLLLGAAMLLVTRRRMKTEK